MRSSVSRPRRVVAGDDDGDFGGGGDGGGFGGAGAEGVDGEDGGAVGVRGEGDGVVVADGDVAAGGDVLQDAGAVGVGLPAEGLADFPAVGPGLVVGEVAVFVFGDVAAVDDGAEGPGAAPVEEVEGGGFGDGAEAGGGGDGHGGAVGAGGEVALVGAERDAVDAFAEHGFGAFGEAGAGGDGVGEGAAVPVFHEGVGELADDGDAAGVAEGEDAVVFEEDDGAAGCGAGEGLVGGAVDGVGVDAAEGFGVEFAEADADRQDVGGCAVEVFFGDEAAVEGVAEVGESGFGAVVVLGEAVDSGAEGVRVGGGVVVVVVLGVDEVAGGHGVADDHEFVGGGGAEDVVDE